MKFGKVGRVIVLSLIAGLALFSGGIFGQNTSLACNPRLCDPAGSMVSLSHTVPNSSVHSSFQLAWGDGQRPDGGPGSGSGPKGREGKSGSQEGKGNGGGKDGGTTEQ